MKKLKILLILFNSKFLQGKLKMLSVLEELGQADTYLYNSETNFQRKIFVKNEKDFDLIKSLPLYKNSVELVKEFPNE